MKFFITLFLAFVAFSSVSHAAKDEPSPLTLDFAYRDEGNPALFALQGSALSQGQFVGACNALGTNCTCEFFSHGKSVQLTNAQQIYYNSAGNYFYCQYSGSTPAAQITEIKLKDLKNNFSSALMPIQNTLSLRDILGLRYNQNIVRTIQEYRCLHTYLQKQGTSPVSFDCSAQKTTCGNGRGNFCLITGGFSYFLYSDNLSNNFTDKGSDSLYGAGSTNSLCGRQILQYSCTGAGGLPHAQFGIYARSEGIWQVPVTLNAAPNREAVNYGYAAATKLVFGQNVCPPGLKLQQFYSANTDLSRLHPSHNIPANILSHTFSSPKNSPSSFQWTQYSGGECNGVDCSLPTTYAGILAQLPYAAQGEAICALPSEILL